MKQHLFEDLQEALVAVRQAKRDLSMASSMITGHQTTLNAIDGTQSLAARRAITDADCALDVIQERLKSEIQADR